MPSLQNRLDEFKKSFESGDRLVHNAHRIEMRGDSMRKSHGKPMHSRIASSGPSERLVQRSCDAPRRIDVGPPERLGGLVVLLDVSHPLPSEIGHRGEHAPRRQ
jgi:hypothetical protein